MLFEWGGSFLLGLCCAGGAYAAAVLLHEGGHAVMGLLFGARCLWIRVGGVLWVPGGGVFVKKSRADGTPGECVLSCPDKKSCILAAAGGSAANLVTGAVFTWGWHFQPLVEDGGFLHFPVLGIIFPVISFLMAILSFFPCGLKEKNDGAAARNLWMDAEFYQKMQINQQKDLLRLEFGILEEMF